MTAIETDVAVRQPRSGENPLKLKRIHHVEFLAGKGKQSGFFYRKPLRFSQLAYSGLETGNRDTASYVLSQGKIRFVVTSPLRDDHPAAEHIRRHGDGVIDIALLVDDADFAFAEAVRRGAGPVRRAAIHTYGDTMHSFISIRDYRGPFLPGYQPAEVQGESAGLLVVDHIVGNVELGKMNEWAEFYHRVMGFSRYITFDDKDISTEYSALMSIVMSDDNRVVKFPINEPAPGRKKSQIDEYLEWYGGPGVQHVALLCGDIIETVARLKANGAELFTKPLADRPTLFFEIIQRKGSRCFGRGNFKALFESIEQEQARRGNL